ncbi:MAG: GntR family transcriptional regulator [Oscillospiraceae bacterium]|nr:GntR family transcriptional regulator [Oscillospiraceae bacterium]
METTIKKIEKVTAGEQVYQSLRENIVANHWKAEDKLPPETELAALYGVNRLTVRMALQRLNALGLVETRVGDGTYVKKFEFADYIDAAQDLYSDPALMEDVCEFRKLIEVECARLAMARATPAEFAALEEICAEYEREKRRMTPPVSDEQVRKLASCDYRFHAQICQMSHNTLYNYCFAMARSTIESYVNLTLRKRITGWEEKSVPLIEGDFRHRAILEAMQRRDFAQCKKLYDDMIDYNIEL